MQIPASLTSIGINAFYDYHDSSSTIPSFITRLTFEENSNCSWIDHCAFYGCSSLTSVSFPSSLTTIGYEAFNNCLNLSSITWDAWNGDTTYQSSSFGGVCQNGTVLVTNPIGSNDSAALLAFLKTKGLPKGWTIAS